MKKSINTLKLSLLLLLVNISIYCISNSVQNEVSVAIWYGGLLVTAFIVGLSLEILSKKSESKQEFESCKKLFIVLMTLATIVITASLIIDGSILITDVLNSIIGTLVTMTYILCLNKPVLAMLILFSAEVLALLTQLIEGLTFTDSMKNLGNMWLLVIVALVVYSYLANKYIDKTKNKFKEIVNYERQPIKIRAWMHIIIWSMVVIVVMTVSNGEIKAQMNNNIYFSIYASLTVLLPTFLMISTLTASALVIEFYVFYIILELYTVYNLFILNQNIYLEIATVLIDVAVLIYMIYNYKKVLNTNANMSGKVKKV